jgi:peroxiredoxin (alkyl hydroperoxide reductase subunit C)
MKRFLLIAVIVFSVTQLWSQSSSKVSSKDAEEDRNFRIPLIGEQAPSFTATSTEGTINFPADYGRKWKILFSHPQDFTPVCSSELLELANLQGEFDKLGVKILVVSADPLDMHEQWKKALEGISYKDRGPEKIKFPIIDDENLAISKKYGMIHPATNSTKAVRGVFIIDPDNVVDAIYFYPMNVGRNTDELIRMVTALQATDSKTTKVMTPANWKAGNDLLIAVPPSTGSSSTPPDGYYNLAWFMWYKKAN